MHLKGTRAGLLAGLGLIAIVSQFYRSSLGVIAPELVRDLSLSPQALGLAGGVFFLALGTVQVPVGMSFDRIGPRRTVAWISVFAVAGALWMSLAHWPRADRRALPGRRRLRGQLRRAWSC